MKEPNPFVTQTEKIHKIQKWHQSIKLIKIVDTSFKKNQIENILMKIKAKDQFPVKVLSLHPSVSL